MMSVGEIIRVARMGRGWSLRKLAERAGVPYVTLSAIENTDRPNPGIGTCLKVARAFGCGLEIFNRLDVKDGAEEEEETATK